MPDGNICIECKNVFRERAPLTGISCKKGWPSTSFTASCPGYKPVIPPAVTSYQLRAKGGAWLGAAREWIQRRCVNGERVTWGSRDGLLLRTTTWTVADIEELAAIIAAAAINEDRERK